MRSAIILSTTVLLAACTSVQLGNGQLDLWCKLKPQTRELFMLAAEHKLDCENSYLVPQLQTAKKLTCNVTPSTREIMLNIAALGLQCPNDIDNITDKEAIND